MFCLASFCPSTHPLLPSLLCGPVPCLRRSHLCFSAVYFCTAVRISTATFHSWRPLFCSLAMQSRAWHRIHHNLSSHSPSIFITQQSSLMEYNLKIKCYGSNFARTETQDDTANIGNCLGRMRIFEWCGIITERMHMWKLSRT